MKPRALMGMLLSIALFYRCGNPISQKEHLDDFQEIELSEARNFKILKKGSSFVLQILDRDNNFNVDQCIHVDDSAFGPDCIVLNSGKVTNVCLSTTYLHYLEKLDALYEIKGVSNIDLVYSPMLRAKIDNGDVVNVGNDRGLNYEKIIDLSPDLIFFYDFDAGTSKLSAKLESFDLDVIRVAEFKELTPLGVSEWVKFFGIIYGKYDEALEIYTQTAQEYSELAIAARGLEEKPSVYTGMPWKGEWYQPGGKSNQAKYFADAGADYLWKDDEHIIGVPMDREVIFDKAIDADIWINTGAYGSLDAIESTDGRFSAFGSFKNQQVFNNNKRLNASGGNDYWESGLLNPHLVLKDLIKIFHPELLPDHEFYYYQRLE